ncbi:dTDP-4-dehydrorhamnose 3,5-epimerase [Jongsikchunia kroppenstedtii]|uniref:dTDP-4-dehydrorhamnose 3,5-epimerase n=1 Tax=Jongsikchunia kroppenstedtii TaxID=1121721 RepID=UPI00035E75FC|nr:dTDP-4-dehydrorhamnose 3,5-epimerase [Jongsikchunia kroppenstedtii]
MQVRPMTIGGAWVFTPRQFPDERGVFLESFRADLLTEVVGHPLDLQQTNTSVSAVGVVRGIHFADVPVGQAKYVTCTTGAVFDVVVDIRVGSPTYGQWAGVLLDDVDRRAVYVSEGLGHGFISLQDGSTVTYLCSSSYNPTAEHGISPLDPAIGIEWPATARDGSALTPLLSEKDVAAPSLAQAAGSGLLPHYQRVLDYLRSL